MTSAGSRWHSGRGTSRCSCRRFSTSASVLATSAAVKALRQRFDSDGIEVVEWWEEPEYVSVKCRDPDGYVVEASWEPE
jgi:hypothetical protein